MGYIGSHTIIELIKDKRWEVYSLDNFLNSIPITRKRIEKITGKKIKNFNINICHSTRLRSVFRQLGRIDGIIHFAALKSVEESMKKPLLYYKNNILSLINLLECCKEFQVKNFIYSSSCSIYGDIPSDLQPVDEDTIPLPPTSPYAHSKWIGEGILEKSYINQMMKIVSLRYFNPAGADPSALIGEDPAQEVRNLVNVITWTGAQNIKKDRNKIIKPMSVFGTDYSTRDGTCIRDYIHINDIAKAHVDALNYLHNLKTLKKQGHYQIFNLGTGKGVTVLEMIQAFEKISGISLNKSFLPRRSGDVVSIYSDSKKSRKILGWVPKYTIKDIVRTAWKWELAKINDKT